MDLSFVSVCLMLIFVIDPLGNIPIFATALARVEPDRKRWVVARECVIAFGVLVTFLVFGKSFLDLLGLSQTSLGIAGGVILFIIAIRIIFPTRQGVFGEMPEGEPFVVPLAIPLMAGPSALATVLLLVSRAPERLAEWLLALTVAVGVATFLLVLGQRILDTLGSRAVVALERLMGLILTAIATEMLMNGIREFIESL